MKFKRMAVLVCLVYLPRGGQLEALKSQRFLAWPARTSHISLFDLQVFDFSNIEPKRGKFAKKNLDFGISPRYPLLKYGRLETYSVLKNSVWAETVCG